MHHGPSVVSELPAAGGVSDDHGGALAPALRHVRRGAPRPRPAVVALDRRERQWRRHVAAGRTSAGDVQSAAQHGGGGAGARRLHGGQHRPLVLRPRPAGERVITVNK